MLFEKCFSLPDTYPETYETTFVTCHVSENWSLKIKKSILWKRFKCIQTKAICAIVQGMMEDGNIKKKCKRPY